MKKFVICLSVILSFTTCAVAQNSGELQLAQKGKSNYVITLPSDAIPAETTAAQQFQKYFSQITGADLPIKSEVDVDSNMPQILIGMGERVKVLLPTNDVQSLGSDGIIIKTVGKDLILAGDRPRGSLYAVFQFLEDVAGCRWWTPAESTIPHKSTFTIAPQNTVYTPPFAYREHYTNEVQTDPIFVTIMRENGDHQKQTEAWGGHYTILGFVHTFSRLLPPEKYFSQHPEWYSDPANGNKPCTSASKMPPAQRTQLNLSDPQVLDELTRQALAWIKQNPQAGYISISQNDNQNYCQDAASMKLAQAEGSQAAPVLNFVNKVAERIHQQYPDFKVKTLAYQYTEKPPKTIRPGKNVIIRLAPSASDFGHPLDSDWNAATRDSLKNWAQIAPELFVWNYVTNFRATMFPYPNWAGLDKDLRFFAQNNVKGVFEQGDNYTNGVGDFVQLRAWLIAHLMWNPNANQQQLTDEFLQGYYGAAAPYLKQYLDLMEASFLTQKRKLSTYNSDFSFLDLDTANQAIRLFQQAANAVKSDKVLLDRVHRESLSLQIAILFRYNILEQTAAREGKKFLGPEDPQAAMMQFIADAKSFGIHNWSENSSFENQIPRLEDIVAAPVALPEFARKYPAADVMDIQQGDFSLVQPGKLSGRINDPAASDGKSAYIVGNTGAWAIQVRLYQLWNTPIGKWHVYAMARVDTEAGVPQTGAGLQCGIYDTPNNVAVDQQIVPLSQVANPQYHPVDLGVHDLNGGMYIWLAPTNNLAVEKVYVDRLILIQEK